MDDVFEILDMDENVIRGKIVPLQEVQWCFPLKLAKSLSVNSLKGILHSYSVDDIYITETDPSYILINYCHWRSEGFRIGLDVWDWLRDRSWAALSRKNKQVDWKREGF
jgi:hypothetical protein